MRPLRIRLRNVGPFDQADLDLSSVAGPIVAITGRNGSGKTMLIESMLAACYRILPSRSAGIYRYCRGKDSQIVLDFEFGGQSYEALLNIDAQHSEMECFLTRGLTTPLSDGKTKSFDDAIVKLLGSQEIVLASVFACQSKKGSFLQLEKAKRKGLFISLLGLQKLELISVLASRKASDRELAYQKLSGKCEALRARASETTANIDNLRSDLADITALQKSADECINDLRAEMVSRKRDLELLAAAEKRYDALTTEIRNCVINLSGHNTRLRQIEKIESEIASLSSQGLLLVSDEIQTEPIQKEIVELQEKISSYHAAARDYSTKFLSLDRKKSDYAKKRDLALQRIKDWKRAEETIDLVPCKGQGEFSACRFLTDAIASKESLESAYILVDQIEAGLSDIAQEISECIVPDNLETKKNETRLYHLQTELAKFNKNLKVQKEFEVKMAALKADSAHKGEIERLLMQERAREEDLRSQTLIVQKELVAARESTKLIEDLKAKIEILQADMLRDETKIRDLNRQIAYAESKREEIEKAKVELQLAENNLAIEAETRKVYELLHKAFGKTGIQSLEIDAAGPAVSSIANDLLYHCFGPRFSIKFVTQRPKKDGEGYADDFDVYVFDQERNREGSIDDLSGGEKVIVNEALGLAIALFNQQRSNIGWQTLFRDEVSGALDDDNAIQYIQMLRRAREIGGFDKLYFIAHQARVIELADSRIKVSNGQIEL